MTDSPTPEQIYARAKEEGRRRLGMPPLEQAATGFIAGVTIVFGIVALGVVTSHIETDLGSGVATVFGAAAFGIGLVFLVVGRSELFTEDFFDPVAVAIDERKGSTWVRLARLWAATLILNLVGGSILVGVLTVEGALPAGSVETLVAIAEEFAAKGWAATLARAVLAGALITLLSYLLNATDSVTSRILLALLVGFLLALGPFDHVVVSALHLLFGIWLSGNVSVGDLAQNIALATAGNLVGGLALVTFSHSAQVKSARG
ncbi:MAG TPA: formate/nitrite transporter family protein [Acidimicrobiia bacterium]